MKTKETKTPLEDLLKLIAQGSPNDGELQLYSALHEKYGLTDPYNQGIERMASLVDALLKFLGKKYAGSDGDNNVGTFNGLIPKQVQIEFTDKPSIGLNYRIENGICIIVLPKLGGQSPEEEASRYERIAERFSSGIPINIYNVMERIIRGMPDKARENLLQQHGKPTESKKGKEVKHKQE